MLCAAPIGRRRLWVMRFRSVSICRRNRLNELCRARRCDSYPLAYFFDVVRLRFSGLLTAKEYHGRGGADDAGAALESSSDWLDRVGIRFRLWALPTSRRYLRAAPRRSAHLRHRRAGRFFGNYRNTASALLVERTGFVHRI